VRVRARARAAAAGGPRTHTPAPSNARALPWPASPPLDSRARAAAPGAHHPPAPATHRAKPPARPPLPPPRSRQLHEKETELAALKKANDAQKREFADSVQALGAKLVAPRKPADADAMSDEAPAVSPAALHGASRFGADGQRKDTPHPAVGGAQAPRSGAAQ
jgi:hypothetical protein